ncbi:hypothetical protein HYR54_08970 [Candidatus Acetothermia bacterium]|nr:hypothetical protein [Candidatus Acetothermia bacterium]
MALKAYKPSEEFRWFSQHRLELSQKYLGKHIAIIGHEVAGHSQDPREAYRQAKQKYPDREPLLAYIPEAEGYLVL